MEYSGSFLLLLSDGNRDLRCDEIKDTRFGTVLLERAKKLNIAFREEGWCYSVNKLRWLFVEDMEKHGYKSL